MDDLHTGRSTGRTTAGAAEHRVNDWIMRFDRAVRSGDATAAAGLFAEDGHWRDILACTWRIRTFSGRPDILGGLATCLDSAGLRALSIATTRTPPRRVERAGVPAIEAFLTFETAYGRGQGVLRLREEDPRHAWVLLTALHELEGGEPTLGRARGSGRAYERNIGRNDWLSDRKAARAYHDRDPEVLVVGGGQAGLSIAARLGQLGVDTLVVERHSRIGDVWRQRYHALTLHNQTSVNHLPYMPFPDTWPTYIPKDKLAGWLEAYAEAMEINCWTSSRLVRGRYNDERAHWDVTVERQGGAERVLHPRHLVWATGISGRPYVPCIPGLAAFVGEAIHTSQYTDGTSYAGRRVLVIGTGNSGHDIAQDLHANGADVTLVQRGSTTIVELETSHATYGIYTEGLSLAEADLSTAATPYPVLVQALRHLTRRMKVTDRHLIDRLDAVGFRQDWGEDETGYQMKYLRQGGGYYINVGCSDLIADGKIDLMRWQEIDQVVPRGIKLRDESQRGIDVIILATGYEGQERVIDSVLGREVAGAVGPIWGIDENGELRNMWRRVQQRGLWFHGGTLAQVRIFSRYLALQIKACELGLIEPIACDADQRD